MNRMVNKDDSEIFNPMQQRRFRSGGTPLYFSNHGWYQQPRIPPRQYFPSEPTIFKSYPTVPSNNFIEGRISHSFDVQRPSSSGYHSFNPSSESRSRHREFRGQSSEQGPTTSVNTSQSKNEIYKRYSSVKGTFSGVSSKYSNQKLSTCSLTHTNKGLSDFLSKNNSNILRGWEREIGLRGKEAKKGESHQTTQCFTNVERPAYSGEASYNHQCKSSATQSTAAKSHSDRKLSKGSLRRTGGLNEFLSPNSDNISQGWEKEIGNSVKNKGVLVSRQSHQEYLPVTNNRVDPRQTFPGHTGNSSHSQSQVPVSRSNSGSQLWGQPTPYNARLCHREHTDQNNTFVNEPQLSRQTKGSQSSASHMGTRFNKEFDEVSDSVKSLDILDNVTRKVPEFDHETDSTVLLYSPEPHTHTNSGSLESHQSCGVNNIKNCQLMQSEQSNRNSITDLEKYNEAYKKFIGEMRNDLIDKVSSDENSARSGSKTMNTTENIKGGKPRHFTESFSKSSALNEKHLQKTHTSNKLSRSATHESNKNSARSGSKTMNTTENIKGGKPRHFTESFSKSSALSEKHLQKTHTSNKLSRSATHESNKNSARSGSKTMNTTENIKGGKQRHFTESFSKSSALSEKHLQKTHTSNKLSRSATHGSNKNSARSGSKTMNTTENIKSGKPRHFTESFSKSSALNEKHLQKTHTSNKLSRSATHESNKNSARSGSKTMNTTENIKGGKPRHFTESFSKSSALSEKHLQKTHTSNKLSRSATHESNKNSARSGSKTMNTTENIKGGKPRHFTESFSKSSALSEKHLQKTHTSNKLSRSATHGSNKNSARSGSKTMNTTENIKSGKPRHFTESFSKSSALGEQHLQETPTSNKLSRSATHENNDIPLKELVVKLHRIDEEMVKSFSQSWAIEQPVQRITDIRDEESLVSERGFVTDVNESVSEYIPETSETETITEDETTSTVDFLNETTADGGWGSTPASSTDSVWGSTPASTTDYGWGSTPASMTDCGWGSTSASTTDGGWGSTPASTTDCGWVSTSASTTDCGWGSTPASMTDCGFGSTLASTTATATCVSSPDFDTTVDFEDGAPPESVLDNTIEFNSGVSINQITETIPEVARSSCRAETEGMITSTKQKGYTPPVQESSSASRSERYSRMNTDKHAKEKIPAIRLKRTFCIVTDQQENSSDSSQPVTIPSVLKKKSAVGIKRTRQYSNVFNKNLNTFTSSSPKRDFEKFVSSSPRNLKMKLTKMKNTKRLQNSLSSLQSKRNPDFQSVRHLTLLKKCAKRNKKKRLRNSVRENENVTKKKNIHHADFLNKRKNCLEINSEYFHKRFKVISSDTFRIKLASVDTPAKNTAGDDAKRRYDSSIEKQQKKLKRISKKRKRMREKRYMRVTNKGNETNETKTCNLVENRSEETVPGCEIRQNENEKENNYEKSTNQRNPSVSSEGESLKEIVNNLSPSIHPFPDAIIPQRVVTDNPREECDKDVIVNNESPTIHPLPDNIIPQRVVTNKTLEESDMEIIVQNDSPSIHQLPDTISKKEDTNKTLEERNTEIIVNKESPTVHPLPNAIIPQKLVTNRMPEGRYMEIIEIDSDDSSSDESEIIVLEEKVSSRINEPTLESEPEDTMEKYSMSVGGGSNTKNNFQSLCENQTSYRLVETENIIGEKMIVDEDEVKYCDASLDINKENEYSSGNASMYVNEQSRIDSTPGLVRQVDESYILSSNRRIHSSQSSIDNERNLDKGNLKTNEIVNNNNSPQWLEPIKDDENEIGMEAEMNLWDTFVKTEVYQLDEREFEFNAEKEKEIIYYTKSWLKGIVTEKDPNDMYAKLKKVMKAMKYEFWEQDRRIVYNWEVNLRRLAVITLGVHDPNEFTQHVTFYMTEIPKLSDFFTRLRLGTLPYQK